MYSSFVACRAWARSTWLILAALELVSPLSAGAASSPADSSRCAKLFSQEQCEEAADCYLGWLKTHPRDATALLNHGICCGRLGRQQEAIRSYSASLEINSGSWLAWNQRAVARFQVGEFEAAESDLGRAIALNPKNSDLLVERANQRFMRGHYRDAAADFEAARELGDRSDGRVWVQRLLRQLEGIGTLPPPEWRPDLASYRNNVKITELSGRSCLVDMPEAKDPPAPKSGGLANTMGYARTRMSFGGSAEEPLWYAPTVRVWQGAVLHDPSWGVLLENGTRFEYEVASGDTLVWIQEGVVDGWRFVVKSKNSRRLKNR